MNRDEEADLPTDVPKPTLSRRGFVVGTSAVLLASACGDDAGDMDAAIDAEPDAPLSDADPDAPDAAMDAEPDAPPPEPPAAVWEPAFGFAWGVASGDPLVDRVVLWTRFFAESPSDEVLDYVVARDPSMSDVVSEGTVLAGADTDYCAKVDVEGLEAGQTYYYRFSLGDELSPVGRTRTAPSGSVDRLRFAVTSCSDFRAGYFHGYRRIAERTDLQAVFHLGDYIYEYAASESDARLHDPAHEILDLADYRRRYAQYRRDPDLQAAHQQHPFIVVWDDHETANNAWMGGADNHDPGEGEYASRRAAAARAHIEWMPMREQAMDGQIWRSFRYGSLAEIFMLDTRIWGRSEQAGVEEIDDPARTLLGADQRAWLLAGLEASDATYKLVAQQVMFAPLELGGSPLNLDQWDGYGAARDAVAEALATTTGAIVLTGDIHSSWANDVPAPGDRSAYSPETGEGSIAAEFVCPGVTSGFISAGAALEGIVTAENSHVKHVDLEGKGYVVLDLSPVRAQADFAVVDGLSRAEGAESIAASYEVGATESHVIESAGALAPIPDAPASAPDLPERWHLEE